MKTLLFTFAFFTVTSVLGVNLGDKYYTPEESHVFNPALVLPVEQVSESERLRRDLQIIEASTELQPAFKSVSEKIRDDQKITEANLDLPAPLSIDR